MVKKFKYLLFLCIACIFFSDVAYADAGLPMIIVFMPPMVVLLIPIILIESIVLKKYLNIKFIKACCSASIGNVLSTLIGVPITWGLLLALQIITGGGGAYGDHTMWQKIIAVTWQAPWLIPYEEQFYWMIPAALAFLMIPFFFVSWVVEGFCIKKFLPVSVKHRAYQAAFYANLASYIFLEICIVCYLIFSVIKKLH